jgi:hypothetical protein
MQDDGVLVSLTTGGPQLSLLHRKVGDARDVGSYWLFFVCNSIKKGGHGGTKHQ